MSGPVQVASRSPSLTTGKTLFHLNFSIHSISVHYLTFLREAKQGGKDEGCIGILNNFYEDGIKWHDIECRHKKPIICQVD